MLTTLLCSVSQLSRGVSQNKEKARFKNVNKIFCLEARGNVESGVGGKEKTGWRWKLYGRRNWMEREKLAYVPNRCIQMLKERGQPYCEPVEMGRRVRQNSTGWRCVLGEAAGE